MLQCYKLILLLDLPGFEPATLWYLLDVNNFTAKVGRINLDNKCRQEENEANEYICFARRNVIQYLALMAVQDITCKFVGLHFIFVAHQAIHVAINKKHQERE